MQLSVLVTLGMTSLFLSTVGLAQHAGSATVADKTRPDNLVAMRVSPMPAAPAALASEDTVEEKQFKGIVVDEVGEPLAGAVVSVVSGRNQFSVTTTTNAQGEYVISTGNASPMLLATYAGYTDAQQKATPAHPITFQLEAISNYDRQLKKQTKSAGKSWRN